MRNEAQRWVGARLERPECLAEELARFLESDSESLKVKREEWWGILDCCFRESSSCCRVESVLGAQGRVSSEEAAAGIQERQ